MHCGFADLIAITIDADRFQPDVLKVFIDDKSYNSGHGHAYQYYGVDPDQGVIAVVRPDQRTLQLIQSFTILPNTIQTSHS